MSVWILADTFRTHLRYVLSLLRTTGAVGLDTGKPIVTICETGTRASIAASLVAARGIAARPVIHGGIDDWPGQLVAFRRYGGSG